MARAGHAWVLSLEDLVIAQARAAEGGEYARAQEYLFWIEDYETRGRRVVRCTWCLDLHRDTASAYCSWGCRERYEAACQQPEAKRVLNGFGADFSRWAVGKLRGQADRERAVVRA